MPNPMPLSPISKNDLLEKAHRLAGLTFQDIASFLQLPCPPTLHHAKGWLGQALERVLGADAAAQPIPDFAHLGIELKTLPISPQGIVLESTYVTYAPIPFTESTWRASTVYKKLNHVLWCPYIAQGPVPERRLAMPFLWTMSTELEQHLKQDWKELREKLVLHEFDSLNAKIGQSLHIRPKAPNSRSFIRVLDHQGHPIQIVPKGFYLRAQFTQTLLKTYFKI